MLKILEKVIRPVDTLGMNGGVTFRHEKNLNTNCLLGGAAGAGIWTRGAGF
jgi:hypothetical protein